jgi:hypothetical protein
MAKRVAIAVAAHATIRRFAIVLSVVRDRVWIVPDLVMTFSFVGKLDRRQRRGPVVIGRVCRPLQQGNGLSVVGLQAGAYIPGPVGMTEPSVMVLVPASSQWRKKPLSLFGLTERDRTRGLVRGRWASISHVLVFFLARIVWLLRQPTAAEA